ncbi:protein-L-isoaspartate(D-aspartate) O-methyltransferase [Methylococcus sp. EFPC2]|uniref:protein-L-isoaspartate(D-aspartate) O-methyltransferase n=1 Tax=Methylococcus sp. EFPC2 TaxID=2812648 RepID=UPI0019674FE2|nr:protein-L-isoaspartate(D-aspartate) O-methyltransferase [Methylococcus sp. EFPC2]QSA97198.1 protein-L-isoaspartate(D-aspartate) O-methyltransferase [Methylococcus sp. EFPC2]
MNRRLQGIGMTSRRTRERMIGRIRELGVKNQSVLDVMLETPRHIFVEEAFASRAYEDMPLPIGFSQTISQPYIVARMTELLLESGPRDKVLEVGTGSGYQTAVLARLCKKVYSVERIYPLQQRARRCLQDLHLRNVLMKHSDGGWGWEDYAPYDGILVTCAPADLPQALLEQLAPGGVLVIPVGDGRNQMLQRIVRTDSGYEIEDIEPVVFVPLLGGVA